MTYDLPALSRRAVLATGAAAAALPAAAADDQSKALNAYLDAQYEQQLQTQALA